MKLYIFQLSSTELEAAPQMLADTAKAWH